MTDPALATKPLPRLVVTPLGGLRRSGRVGLRPSTTWITLIGGLDLDLRDAEVPPAGVTLTKVSLIGGAAVVVPPDVRVEVGGFTLLGGKDVERAEHVPAHAPVLRIRAWSLIGGVRVRVAR